MSFQENELLAGMTRRQFFGRTLWSVGGAALASLLPPNLLRASAAPRPSASGLSHFAPKAKRVIYLFMSGAPSQMDLLDYKPLMGKFFDKDLPESVRMGQRLTTMTSGQQRFPIAPSMYQFKQYGQSGAWVSELLPHLATVVDDIAIVRTVHTEAINHDPAITYIQTGSQLPGKPSLGAWLSYGLGSENRNLPAYVVMTAIGPAKRDAQALFSRLWGSGFLPAKHQGVSLRGKGDPVLYLSNPSGVSASTRRRMLDGLGKLNQHQFELSHDPEINARIAQYEMAFRMQSSVPDLTDISGEPESTFELYGPESRKPGTFAYNCLLARRLAERDVRCIQLFHRDWDHHTDLPRDLSLQCKDMDQPAAALIKDLKSRGMLDDTLVVWGGEFGRTIYCQGTLTRDNYGRDHHPRCFTMWLAGGGIKGGVVHGETDDFSYNIVRDPVHIRDLNATILHCLGLDHERVSFQFQGLDQRLTGVEEAHPIREILS
jgi:hypothetical protein